MTASGSCISGRFVLAVSMNVGIVSSQRACGGDDEMRRVEAAGPVDAQNAPTRSLEKRTERAFPQLPHAPSFSFSKGYKSIDGAEHNSMIERMMAARHHPTQPETTRLLPIASCSTSNDSR